MLNLPVEAIREFCRQHRLPSPGTAGGQVDWPLVHEEISKIAAPVVVAELRGIANELRNEAENQTDGVATRTIAIADQLSGRVTTLMARYGHVF